MDFLNYWDTRIDANERFFNDYPHIANFAFSECQELWDHMSADHAALRARHAALVEAAKPVAAWWRKERMVAEPPYQIEHLVLGTDGPECVGVDELDALAALVGEEK